MNNRKGLKYLVFVETEGLYSERQGETCAYIRYDFPPLDTLEEAQQAVRLICLNNEYKAQDFRIFVEYPVRREGGND